MPKRKEKKRRFFLFNDLLIYAHLSGPPPERRLVVDRTFFLETTSIVDCTPDTPDSEFAFQIIGVGKSFIVYADSLDHKQEWRSILNVTIEKHKEHHRLGGGVVEDEAAVVWIPDDAVDDCMICSKEFNSLLRRKHHCRKCGKIVCGECSKGKAIVPGVSKHKEVRVCDKCKEITT